MAKFHQEPPMKTLTKCTPCALLLTGLSLGCAAESVAADGEPGSSEEALSACTRAIPDRTAENLSAIPFQSLERGNLPLDVATIAWGYPTKGRTVPGNFGDGRSYNEGHEGADVPGSNGDAILAAANGTVAYTLTTCPNSSAGRNQTCGNGWGAHVVIRHVGNIYTRYAHLSAVSVKVGDPVTRGQRIGSLGTSGLSDGPHLHFELGKRAATFAACSAPQNFDKVYNPAKLRFDRAPLLGGALGYR
jgi:murein DD-endopeptidase MepM/ murein hydrolase activator NlpD